MSRFLQALVRGSVVAAIVTLFASHSYAEPVAVIAAVKGKVEITSAHAKSATRAVFGRALEHGDKVSVGSGGAATVFFNDGNVIELAAKSAITIGGRVASSARGGAISTDVYAQVSRYVTAGSRQTGLVTMAKMRGEGDQGAPMLLSPRSTSILSDQPFFTWRAVPGATVYRIRVSKAGGDELWSRETGPAVAGADLAFRYPSDVASLTGDTDIEWEVQALDNKTTLRRESTIVRVLSPAAREDVRTNLASIMNGVGGQDSPAAHFLAGSYLAGLDIYEDALDQFRLLVDLDPKAPGPHEALGNAYLNVGLVDLAAAEFQQALALQRDTR